jgi:rsbT antagonist protein RsbS
MEQFPILAVGDFMLISVRQDMSDTQVMSLQDELSRQVILIRPKGVLLDISSLEIVDSFLGRTLSDIAKIVRMLGAEVVVVGMQPTVAMTTVELGLTLGSVLTALNVNSGMKMLRMKTLSSTSLAAASGRP